ncbi:MAG: glycosyltransferase [Thermoanaerobacteraceae bacterium]|nr:glycosyltransferase [Thermoanaerobacteraceae bacterium]
MQQRKVIFLTTGLAYGGAETQLVNLATRLKKRGWDVRVVSMLPPQAFTEELAAAGIPLATLNMRRGVPDPRAVFKMVKILRQWWPHIIHSHMVHANLLARVTRLFYRIPVVISTAHNINEGGRWREIAYRLTDFLTDLTTNVSRAAVDRYIKVGAVPKDKIIFMPNGIDTFRFQFNLNVRLQFRKDLKLNNNFTWLAVGRFEEAKDYPNLLQAFKRVADERNDALLLIAGQGTLFEEIKGMAHSLGLTEKVRFLGVRRDVPELMSASDAYVMSSAWEGLPMVLLEAAACELPIVATDVGGNSEIVLHEINGYIVPPRDSEALAAAMLKMMSLSEEERKAMGRAGRAHIEENYSLDHVVDRWEKLYIELLKQKGIR